MAHPIPRWLPALLVLAGASFQPALACQCIAPREHGFVHPEATVLPANAQGVLFHAPADAGLTPDMFTATRLPDGARQRIRIMEVTLPAGHPMRPRLREGTRLVRVGVEGGFIAGARYAIAWQEPGASANAGRSGVEFGIDPAPLDLAGARFATTLDGPARRTMLAMETNGGQCSVSTPAIAQALRIQVPAALQRYAPALSLLTEGQEAMPGAAFETLQYQPSLCTEPLFDRTALGAGRDMLYRDCRASVERVRLRTWVGMLEVSDEFVLAAPATADLGPAAGSATPTLLAGLDGAPESYAQARLLRALMQVAPDDGEVAATLSRTLLGSPINGLAADDYAGLQRFATHATALVPVIEHLIAGVRWPREKVALRQLIGAMALAPARKAALLGKLEQCKLP